MKFLRTALLLCPACLLAQTTGQTPPATRQATPVPLPAQTKNGTAATPAQPNQGQLTPGGPPVTIPLAIPKPAVQVPPDTVILTVGDFSITAAQFDALADGLQDQYKAFVRGPGRKQFADQLVKVLTLAQEGKRRGLDQAPTFKEQLKFQQDQVLANATAQKITQDAKVDDAALHKYYDDHKVDYEQMHAHHILIRFQGSPVPVKPGAKDLTDQEALAKAQDIEKKLAAGGDFSKEAQEESDDTGSGANGGDLGSFGHSQMVAVFEEAAQKLKPGQISEPVKSQFGYHIIRLDSVDAKSFDDVKPDIEKKLRPQLATEAMEALQKNTKIVYNPEFFGMQKQ
ncbi:MAG TPA: peptidylprolyl isomerase [Bryobacteraceae bacterium]|jgi:peptidyl-prolyl cis-trans isomerase C|nr:peptidylprolyl isomerase [Bryobacteraceae bacterium]